MKSSNENRIMKSSNENARPYSKYYLLLFIKLSSLYLNIVNFITNACCKI